MSPKKILLPYTYRKAEQGLKVKQLHDLALADPSLDPTQLSLIVISPNGFGGNHRHPRTEIFHCPTGNLTLLWQDQSNQLQQMQMVAEESEQLVYFEIPSQLPHTVVNRTNSDGILIEYASGPQQDVEPTQLIK